MKKLVLLFAVIATLFIGCKKDKSDTLNVSPENLTFAAAGEAKTLTVDADIAWTVTSDAAWCTVNPASGSASGTITVTAAPYTEQTADRTAKVTVKGNSINRIVNVTQTKVPAATEKPAKATVSGKSKNDCPETTVTLTAAATGAASFKWYNGNTEIAGATGKDYVVTATGTYYAAGVNNIGEGDKSDAKAVEIVTCEGGDLLIDKLVGEWEGVSVFVFYNSSTQQWNAADIIHSISVTKVNNTTLKLNNCTGKSEMLQDPTVLGDEVLVTVNNSNNTITFPSTKVEPSWYANGIESHIFIDNGDPETFGYGEDFVIQVNTSGSDYIMEPGTYYSDNDVTYSWNIGAVQDGELLGLNFYGANTIWTKYGSGDVVRSAKATMFKNETKVLGKSKYLSTAAFNNLKFKK
jgi:hypothetical protein